MTPINLGTVPTGTSGITFPIRLEGHDAMAVLGTGADISCLSTKFAEAHQLRGSNPLEYYMTNQQKPSTANTCTVSVECGTRKYEHKVLILPFLGHEFLLGRDLMSAFGIKIAGLPLEHPVSEEGVQDRTLALRPAPETLTGIEVVFHQPNNSK